MFRSFLFIALVLVGIPRVDAIKAAPSNRSSELLIECKHEKRRTERQDVQILHSKLQSIGAQKGMIFSTAGFQEGAVQYAETHGIALVQIAGGETSYFSRSMGAPKPPPAWLEIPKYIGWWRSGNHMSVLSPTKGDYTREALGLLDSIDEPAND